MHEFFGLLCMKNFENVILTIGKQDNLCEAISPMNTSCIKEDGKYGKSTKGNSILFMCCSIGRDCSRYSLLLWTNAGTGNHHGRNSDFQLGNGT